MAGLMSVEALVDWGVSNGKHFRQIAPYLKLCWSGRKILSLGVAAKTGVLGILLATFKCHPRIPRQAAVFCYPLFM